LRFDKFFPVNANCSSISPLRTAVINMSITVGGLSSEGTAIAVLPFSTATPPNHLVLIQRKQQESRIDSKRFSSSKKIDGLVTGHFVSIRQFV
jgi:hypothetical protein